MKYWPVDLERVSKISESRLLASRSFPSLSFICFLLISILCKATYFISHSSLPRLVRMHYVSFLSSSFSITFPSSQSNQILDSKTQLLSQLFCERILPRLILYVYVQYRERSFPVLGHFISIWSFRRQSVSCLCCFFSLIWARQKIIVTSGNPLSSMGHIFWILHSRFIPVLIVSNWGICITGAVKVLSLMSPSSFSCVGGKQKVGFSVSQVHVFILLAACT